ncbi:hypothetical protein ACU19_06820 [Actinobaculum suis]|nr:hypothetical protein ACU19_06820 [Actinobaculum suis]
MGACACGAIRFGTLVSGQISRKNPSPTMEKPEIEDKTVVRLNLRVGSATEAHAGKMRDFPDGTLRGNFQ